MPNAAAEDLRALPSTPAVPAPPRSPTSWPTCPPLWRSALSASPPWNCPCPAPTSPAESAPGSPRPPTDLTSPAGFPLAPSRLQPERGTTPLVTYTRKDATDRWARQRHADLHHAPATRRAARVRSQQPPLLTPHPGAATRHRGGRFIALLGRFMVGHTTARHSPAESFTSRLKPENVGRYLPSSRSR